MVKTSLSESAIKKHYGPENFERGEKYYKHGSVHNARITGSTLKAHCQGSRPGAYRVEIRFKDDRIDYARCSCPVGDYGTCKHVAAVLLTWLHKPASFYETEPIRQTLQQYSTAELIKVVQYLLARDPDLEQDLALYLQAGHGGELSANAQLYQRQADLVFGRGFARDRDESVVADGLYGIIAPAKEWMTEGNYAAAVANLSGVLASLAVNMVDAYFESGDVDSVAIDCADWLADCWSQVDDITLEYRIIDALLLAYKLDLMQLQGVGIAESVEETVVGHVQDEPDEKAYAIKALEAELAKIRGPYNDWVRGRYAGFLEAMRTV